MTDAPTTCYHVQDYEGTWCHIPGCWASVHDQSACTCAITGSELERAQRGRREAEIYIEKLQDRAAERAERHNQSLQYQRRLHAYMRDAEAQRDTAKVLLHEVMMQIVARPDMQSLFGPAEIAIWERARAFLNALPRP